MDAEVKAFIKRKFAHAPMLQKEMLDLWGTYLGLGLPNSDFLAEFTNGKQPSLFQRMWEMQLARHLDGLGHKVACPNGGPDFRFTLNGVTVWVEAVSPEPKGLPADWLDPNFQGAGDFPHEAILLRWTTAIDAKWKKLAEYRAKGIVSPKDAFIIAVSGSQLGLMSIDRGISQMPFGVEAVFPVGPQAYRIDPETHKIGEGFISERFHILNANKAQVPTTPFLNPAYSGISALIGCCYARATTRSPCMWCIILWRTLSYPTDR
jgi:type I restriction enzyme S subunit